MLTKEIFKSSFCQSLVPIRRQASVISYIQEADESLEVIIYGRSPSVVILARLAGPAPVYPIRDPVDGFDLFRRLRYRADQLAGDGAGGCLNLVSAISVIVENHRH